MLSMDASEGELEEEYFAFVMPMTAVEVEQCAAGVAGVDGAVGLDEVHGRAGGEGDGAVKCADNAGRERERQFAERVADGDDSIANVQCIGVAQNDRGQIRRVDLQNGDVVALVVADERRVIARAVIGRDRDGVGAFNHVIVGEDVAVLRQDEAGAGRGGCGLVAEVVRGDGGRDADGGVHVLRIDLARREYLAGVNGCDLQGCGLPLLGTVLNRTPY